MNLKVGLSGCALEKIDDVIRKHTSTEEYKKRLIKQSEKQDYFSKYIFTRLSTPKILFRGDSYFDMEYIPASSFDKFLSISDIKELNFICDSLDEYFEFLIGNSRPQNIRSNVITKLETLKKDSEYSTFIEYLQNLDIDYNVPKSFCHGDLTFTNILFHKKKLYFIDFLDSFVDTFLIDLCKLKQDLYYHWSTKVQNINDSRLYQSNNYIWRHIEKKYKPYIDTDVFSILDVINLLRIYPYLKHIEHQNILSTLIENTDLYENFNRTYGGEIQ